MSSAAKFVFSLILFLASAALAPTLLHCLKTGLWVETDAEVVGIEIREYGKTRSFTRYLVDVRYQYAVNGEKKIGSSYDSFGRLGEGYSVRQDEALTLAEAYKVGTPLKAYYNPNKTSDAVLSPGFSGYRWTPVVFFVVMVLTLIATVWPEKMPGR